MYGQFPHTHAVVPVQPQAQWATERLCGVLRARLFCAKNQISCVVALQHGSIEMTGELQNCQVRRIVLIPS
jgi:hypothetical protein